MTDTSAPRWFWPAGSLAQGSWTVHAAAPEHGLQHSGLAIATLVEGQVLNLEAGDDERIIVPLAGSCDVAFAYEGAATSQHLAGRADVFAGPTDVLYLGRGTSAQVTGQGRVAVASAPAAKRLPDSYVPANDIEIELRGAGASTRQVHNFGTPGNLDADRLIVCEVITPSQNWSSYPPHKHDEGIPGHESQLEEIYYFEAAPEAGASQVDPGDAFGLFSTYSSPAGQIDINAQVRSGDLAVVPFGYHGPAVAAPGYDLYYLNVMAGPDDERAWLISDDPAHGWVRTTWEHQDLDPRLPFVSPRKEDNA